MVSMFDPRLEISVGTGLTEENSHGVLWIDVVENKKLERRRVFFTLNKPQCVRQGLTYGMWNSLVKQITKMGLAATHIELTGQPGRKENKTFCYSASKYNELFAGVTGRSVIRHGVA